MANAVTELSTSVRMHFEQSERDDSKWANVFERLSQLELSVARLTVSNRIVAAVSLVVVTALVAALVKLYPGLG